MCKILTISIILLLISCNTNRKSKVDSSKPVLTVDSLNSKIEAKDLIVNDFYDEIYEFDSTISGFIEMIEQLNRNSLKSVKISRDYITYRLEGSVSIPDSVYYMYLDFFYETVNTFNDTLYDLHANLIPDLEEDKRNSDTKEFNSMLSSCGLILLMSEGYFYVDSEPDYFFTLFNGRLSKSLSDYQNIRKTEMKEGFSEDAGMLISFEQLALRIKTWEDYINDYPDAYNIEEARFFYQTYLETFLTGMDNSRVYDLEDEYVLPEIRELYTMYINDNPGRESTKIIADYYKFIERHEFKYNDSIAIFLKKHKLSSMLGVQPHLR